MTKSKLYLLLSIYFVSSQGVCNSVVNSTDTHQHKDQDSSALDAPAITKRPFNELTPNPQGDISYSKLTNRNPDCAAYTGEYTANIVDYQQGIHLNSSLSITAQENSCTFISNNIPNHDIGNNTTTGEDFESKVAGNTLNYVIQVPRHPKKKRWPRYIRKIASNITLNGILLNGVDLDMDSAFCYHPDFNTVNNVSLGTREQCGLFADWFAIPAANPSNVALDEFTGHAFDGRYHYHGDNNALSNVEDNNILQAANTTSRSGSPVIGFAADGFPIYGHYFYDAKRGQVRKAQSSWQINTSERESPMGSKMPPPAIETHPRGMFVEDWYFKQGSGDLDECNGMTDAYGNYGYYYTEEYPYGPLCTFGTPDDSFVKHNTEFKGQNTQN